MAFVFKSIVPPAMDIDQYRLEYLNELRKEGRKIKREYQKTTRTWKRKPKFEIIVGLGRGADAEASVLVGTDDEIYGYVDEGTEAHPISARRKPFLKFRTGFTPKTSRGRIGSRRGGRSGGWVSKKRVMHPGTKSRNFTPTIAARREGPFVRNMRKANERATDKVFS